MAVPSFRAPFSAYVRGLQDTICEGLAQVDGGGELREDTWERPAGGGGRTRILSEGAVFEKGGVAVSAVHGELPEPIRARFGVKEARFFATGVSLVIHPRSPMIPTVHANFRYFELYGDGGEGDVVDAWFGGGADLTPYYLVDDDAAHFHRTLKAAADPHGAELYPRFKAECDRYFHNAHRGEGRGIGGVFFDYLRGDEARPLEAWHAFVTDMGRAFLPAYLPIVRARRDDPWGDAERYFQELRRGRYVEFNLIHDRGTLFGLKTDGRVESILMSLPPRVRWDYGATVAEGSREARLLDVLKTPRDWA